MALSCLICVMSPNKKMTKQDKRLMTLEEDLENVLPAQVNVRRSFDSSSTVSTFSKASEPIVMEMRRRCQQDLRIIAKEVISRKVISMATQTEEDYRDDLSMGITNLDALSCNMSSCSCQRCLLSSSLPDSEFGLTDAFNRDLFIFEDDFDRLSEADCEMDDFCFDDLPQHHDRETQNIERLSSALDDEGVDLLPLRSRTSFGNIGGGVMRHNSSTDTTMTETSSSHDDSGVGRTTDESVKADESSEQETMESYVVPYKIHHHGNKSASSVRAVTSIPSNDDNDPATVLNEEATLLNRDFYPVDLHGCSNAAAKDQFQDKTSVVARPARLVPRMGTRLDYCRPAQTSVCAMTRPEQKPSKRDVEGPSPSPTNKEPIWTRQTPLLTRGHDLSVVEMPSTKSIRDGSYRGSFDATQALKVTRNGAVDVTVTANIGCSIPPALPTKDLKSPEDRPMTTPDTKKKNLSFDVPETKPFGLDRDGIVPERSSSRSVEQTTCVSSERKKTTCMASQTVDSEAEEDDPASPMTPVEGGGGGGRGRLCRESLQRLYAQYVDVMYTNRANLAHTMMVQQRLFNQQLQQQQQQNGHGLCRITSDEDAEPTALPSSERRPDEVVGSPPPVPMEWVVKRRADGTRYIARRPMIRRRILRDRAEKLEMERCGATTDDDAASELKTGRYWTRDERKQHVEKARSHRRQKEEMALELERRKIETVNENEDDRTPNIIELSRKKAMRHKSRRVFDGFTTLQEVLAHGNSDVAADRCCNPLLSVTTV